ncbi:hypothetical protein [Streptomyces sp. S.PB5]|uniref:hypothetical protein n=1 Tax=Streptomyces sp. S.PB5 TaxID=3020844 RepID=UPI0025AF7161|nr:hypothetical protein [Streptomyces sp. S.PB5]MDN3024469.1 hypothetical protein [Streptomyces sp. S.PB5]
MPCPDCDTDLPWQAGGQTDVPKNARRPTVQEAYDKAAQDNGETLKKYLNTKYDRPARHKRVALQRHSSEDRPCRFDGWPEWLLAHCPKPEDVDQWVPKLQPWWTPPAPTTH